MRTPIIAGNWKMHKTRAKARAFVLNFLQLDPPSDREYIIGVTPTLLSAFGHAAESSFLRGAAQNMHFENDGAFTGEVSPLQVKDAGAKHVILGHSERRHIFGEDNDLLNKKMRAAEEHDIIPIYCVGETLEERNAGREEEVVLEQLQKGLEGLSEEFIKRVIVAYEPVWAIGTGETATPEQAEAMHAVIRKHIPEETRVLYGGSVKPANAQELMDQPSIDGFLVGGASLETDSFFDIASVTLK